MDTALKIDPSSSNSTSKVIENIHSMPWLKQDPSSSHNSKMQRSVGPGGKIISAKKTDEDYFPGTREEKKGKKRKEKKGKSIVAYNLEDLVNLTHQSENRAILAQDFIEIPEYNQPRTQQETAVLELSVVNQTATNNSVWSTATSVADKLFPNVQSVRIDRLDEEEMLSKAIAESIASIQLEQFNKPSPIKEDRWDSLYGNDDEEGGWDNVKRNLPPSPETVESSEEASSQKKSCDDNNNSSNNKSGGILKNKEENPNRYLTKPEELDFCFRKSSEHSKDEVKTSDCQSLKSVSFDETITVKIRSSESSENDESEQILNIDKYGRVGGYSERRLFMGKGARRKEMEFIKNNCSLGTGDMRCQSSSSIPKATAFMKTEKPAIIYSQYSKNSLSQKPIPNLKAPHTDAVENFHRRPETATAETQKPVETTLECPKNLQSRESIPNLDNPEVKKTVVVTNVCKTPEAVENTKQNADRTEKLTDLAVESSVDKSSSESLSVSQSSTASATDSCNDRLSSVESELGTSEKKELEPIKSEAQAIIKMANIETPHDEVSDTSGDTQMKSELIKHERNELVSPVIETISSENEKPVEKMDELSQKEEILQKNEAEDLKGNIATPQATMSKDLATLLDMVNNLKEEDSESRGQCLVPTLRREDTSYYPPINFQSTDSIEGILNAKFQSPACQNLLLAGVSYSNSSCDAQSLMTSDLESQNSLYQNYPSHNSIPPNTATLQSQTLNNMQHVQPTCIRSGESIYQNTPINQLPNLNNNIYPMLPNYANVGNEEQMDQTNYAHFAPHLALQNFPYQSAGLLANPDHRNISGFMESRENVFSSKINEDLGSMTDYNTHEKTQNDGRQYLAQVPPGFARRFQLPPGFTKKEFIPRDDTYKDERVIDSAAVKGVINDKTKNQKRRNKKSELRSTSNSRAGTSGNPAESKSVHCERNTSLSNAQISNKRRNYCKSQTNEPQDSKYTEKRRVPYPILGATQSSQEKYGNSKNHQLESNQSHKLHRDSIIIKSPSNDNKTKNSMGAGSTNNNYFPSLGSPLGLNRQGINNPNIVSQSGIPVVCQIPDHQSLGLGNMTNWPYNVNITNPAQVPINFVPNYQIPVTNPHNFLATDSANYFKPPMHQNVGFQQLPMHMLSPPQVPGYPIPQVFNAVGNNPQNTRPANIGSPQMKSMLNYDPSIDMQRSIIGAPSCGNYNLNETHMSQFMSSLNFHETETVPNIQDSWNLLNNQTNNATGPIFDNVARGRGRGRLLKDNLS